MTIHSDISISLIDENKQQFKITDITKNSYTSFTTYYDTNIQ